jgi:hypothetical protein
LDRRFWQDESFSEDAIKFRSDVAGVFHVLFLVFPYGYHICIIEENIRCHQNRIIEDSYSDFSRFPFCQGVFVTMHSFHRPHYGDTRKHPIQLSVSGNICGVVDVDFIGVDSDSFVELQDGKTSLPQDLWVVNSSQSVHIRQKEKKFCLFFLVYEVDEGLYGSKEVSEMELFTGRFDSGEDSFHCKDVKR